MLTLANKFSLSKNHNNASNHIKPTDYGEQTSEFTNDFYSKH